MSALMIARITVKDPAKFQDYLARSKRLATTFGAELLHRGEVKRALNGADDHQIAVIARFPSMDALEDWYDSDAYQPLKALRDAGTDMQMTAYAIGD